MKRRRCSVTLAAFLGALFSAPPPALSLDTRLNAAEREARVEALFEKWNRPDTPGCALGVGQEGQTLLTRAWGMADLENDVKNTPETIFEGGSVSKQFTAAAVLLLAQASKLSLDDPVRKYIPDLPDYRVPLTIRHMLHHTSGLRDWGSVASIAGWPRGSRVHTHAHVLDIVSRQRALNFAPGSEHSYTNTGYNLAAILVARVGEESFAEFTRKRIFEPLEMRHTSWRDDHTRVLKARAVAYSARGDGYATEMPFENVHGNGGLLTTVGDLLLWNENYVHFRVGGTEFVKEQLSKGRLNDGREISYARGLYVTSYRGVAEISHSGSTAGYRAFLARYPERSLSIALLCNAGDANTRQLVHAVAELFFDLPEAAATPTFTVRIPAWGLALGPGASAAGLFRNSRTGEALSIVLDGGVLRYEHGPWLTALSKTRFRLDSGAFVDLELGVDGRIRRLWTTSPTGDVEAYEPVVRARPSAEKLLELVGSYVSDEAETTLAVVVDKGALLLRRRPDSVFALKPLYADAWEAPLGMLRFRRDTTGRVTGLSLSVPRVRDMPFERMQ